MFSSGKEIVIPKSLSKNLCKALNLGKGCSPTNNNLYLNNITKLDNEKLLLFFNLSKPQTMYGEGFANIPVLIDKDGHYKVSNNILGPQFGNIQRDRRGGLWVEMNTITGDYSSDFFYSKDGLNWKYINIEVNDGKQMIDSRNSFHLCILEDSMLFKVNGINIARPYGWKTTYLDLLNATQQGEFVKEESYKNLKCLKYKVKNNHWTKRYDNEKIYFSNSKTSLNLSLEMSDLRGDYTIQLGVFSDLKNIDRRWYTIYCGMDEYYDVIVKKMKFHNKIVYKVFLDTFFEREDAKKTLQEIQNDVTVDAKLVEKAFVTKFPHDAEVVEIK